MDGSPRFLRAVVGGVGSPWDESGISGRCDGGLVAEFWSGRRVSIHLPGPIWGLGRGIVGRQIVSKEGEEWRTSKSYKRDAKQRTLELLVAITIIRRVGLSIRSFLSAETSRRSPHHAK